jgi:hypothetical protein
MNNIKKLYKKIFKKGYSVQKNNLDGKIIWNNIEKKYNIINTELKYNDNLNKIYIKMNKII